MAGRDRSRSPPHACCLGYISGLHEKYCCVKRLGDLEQDPYLKGESPDLHPFMLVAYSRTNNNRGTPIARDVTCLYFTGFIKGIAPNCAFIGGDFSFTATSDGRQHSVRTLFGRDVFVGEDELNAFGGLSKGDEVNFAIKVDTSQDGLRPQAILLSTT